MSKVEELREQIRAYLGDIDDNQHRDITKEVIDSLIAAAELQGKRQLASDVREVMLSVHDGYDFDDDPAWKAYERIMAFLSPAPKETTLDKAGVILRGQHGVDW